MRNLILATAIMFGGLGTANADMVSDALANNLYSGTLQIGDSALGAIIDKGDRSDNWIETSGSAMFTYAFAKGFHKGLLDKSFGDASDKAFASIIKNYVYADEKGDIHLDQAVKVGSLNLKNSKGDYSYYITSERRINDYKGLAALLYASMELKK